jgi:hypothetical protein
MYHLHTSITPLIIGITMLSLFGFLCTILSYLLIQNIIYTNNLTINMNPDDDENEYVTVENKMLDMSNSNTILSFVNNKRNIFLLFLFFFYLFIFFNDCYFFLCFCLVF